MDTERLYGKLDEASNEISDIRAREQRLIEQINGLINAFGADHGCSDKSVNYAIDYTADALLDLFDDAEGPAARRKIKIELEISEIEEADLRRSAVA